MRFNLLIIFLIIIVECLEDNESISPVRPSSVFKFPSFEEWKRENSGLNFTDDDNKTSIIDGYKLGEALLRKRGRSKIRLKEERIGEEIEKEEENIEEERKIEENYEIGKIYKERFNFASFDCAATIIKTNSEAKFANSILNDNKDNYLLNECESKNQFIIIELCEDILIDEVIIGNFEFYSSNFKRIRFSISDRYPVKEWIKIGEFEAIDKRGNQKFNINNPIIWAKFIKIEILSHYGNEFYCTISTIQVFGKTMMEQFKEELPAPKIILNKEIESLKFDIKLSKAFSSCFEINSNIDKQNECSKGYLKLEQFLKDEGNKLCKIDEENEYNLPIQDSIYKNIIKRLNSLENNITLTQKYIEEQWKFINKGLKKIDKKFNEQNEIINYKILEFENKIELINESVKFYKKLIIIIRIIIIIIILLIYLGINLN